MNSAILEILTGIINKEKTDICEHYKKTIKLPFQKEDGVIEEINIYQVEWLIKTNNISDIPTYVNRVAAMYLVQQQKEFEKHKGNTILYKGYEIEKDNQQLREYIDFRESLLNKINDEFYTHCLNLIQEHKKFYPNDFIFGVLDKTLFLNQKDNKLLETQYKQLKHSTIVYNRNLKRVQTFCNIETRLTSHVARHTFTNQLLRMENVNLYDVSQSLGHSNIKITENYINSGFNIEKTDYLNIELSKKFKKM